VTSVVLEGELVKAPVDLFGFTTQSSVLFWGATEIRSRRPSHATPRMWLVIKQPWEIWVAYSCKKKTVHSRTHFGQSQEEVYVFATHFAQVRVCATDCDQLHNLQWAQIYLRDSLVQELLCDWVLEPEA
jgi:hypothetical protein